MAEEKRLVPQIAITSIASGLLMMAFFTAVWAGIAYGSLAGKSNVILIVFCPLIFIFILAAIYFFVISKRFPKLSNEADKAERKKTGMWFGIIFGAEGLVIFIAVSVVVNLGHADLAIPVIALIVGLHFYPLARIFKRSIDYYLASWATLVAICGIALVLNKTYRAEYIYVFVGMGLAAATSCYGLYMIYNGRRMATGFRND
jgi:hypothetical protein